MLFVACETSILLPNSYTHLGTMVKIPRSVETVSTYYKHPILGD